MMEGSVKNFPPRLSVFFKTVLVHSQTQLIGDNLFGNTDSLRIEAQIEPKKMWQSGGIFLNGY
jgi:hypothetical protein